MENLDSSFQIPLAVSDGTLFLKIDKIIRFEAIQKQTLVFTTDSEKPFKILCGITDIHNKLLSHKEFFQCHRSHIVSIGHIEKFIKKQRILITKNGNVPIAKVFAKSFEEKYCK